MALTSRQTKRKAFLENALDAIEQAQLGSFSGKAQQLTVNGRSLTRFPPQELEELRRNYESELIRLERKEQGRSGSRTIRVYG